MITLYKFGVEAITHTLSGTRHTGQLSDGQVPDYITRDSELLTVSGVLYDQMGDIDVNGGNFV